MISRLLQIARLKNCPFLLQLAYVLNQKSLNIMICVVLAPATKEERLPGISEGLARLNTR